MSCPHAYLKCPHAIIATFAFHLFLFTPQVWAAPHSINLVRRDSHSNTSKTAAITVSLVFLIAGPIIYYWKEIRSMLRRISLPSLPVRQRPSPANVRDLTAEEIAGTAATDEAQAASVAQTNRRTGRNRRTPSQISTRSLPAYMKEPGELELVIIQGSQDMEDAPLTTQVVMPSVREDDESANSHSRGPSQASYVIVHDDPLVETPLLERNDSNESTHEQLQNALTSARSVDISDAQHTDQLSPLPNSAEIPDPRGEAPPYFEVVGDLGDVGVTSGDLARVDTADTLPIAPDTLPASDNTTTSHPVRRRSMFRGLIDAASRALSSPHPASPTMSLSRPSRDTAVSPSPRPSNLSSRQGGARSPLSGHRASPSHGSVQSMTSSAFGRVVTRTHSRSVTNVTTGLTSPSAISIGSISAPLTHTALRTDFVYPRTGPTPEQLKLISSVESVSKFGVPYGPDAVRFASESLVNLHGPPPEFEEHPSTDGPPGPSGETRPRAGSALSRVSRDGNPPDSRISLSSQPSSLRESIVPPESAAHESESSSSHPNPTEPRSPVPDQNNDNASVPEPGPEHFEDKKEPLEVDSPIRTVPPRIPSPSPTVGTTSTAVTVTKATAAELGVVPEFPEGAASSSPRPALPSFATETAATTRTAAAAPSSFRMPPTSHDRTHLGSRSSSIETFRTAASKPGQGPGSDRGASDTEQETDAFTDAESGAETEVETRPASPRVVHVESTVLAPEPPALSAS